MAKLVQLIETEVARGAGVEADPSRVVRQWWTPDGVLVVERDAWAIEQAQSIADFAYRVTGASRPLEVRHEVVSAWAQQP